MAELNTEGKRGMLTLTTDTVITHDATEEFILPDYVSEIRKLLHTKTGVLPESKYVSDEGQDTRLELGGTVTYMLIYTDDEGKLCSLPLTSSYEASTLLNSHPTEIFVDTVADSVSARVLAPRKISLKTRLKSRIHSWESKEHSEKIENKSSSDELFIERSKISLPFVEMKQVSLGGVKLNDKLDTHGVQIVRPLWCDASTVVKDVKAQNNSVSVRGEARIKCVCQTEEDTVILTKELPIAEEIATQGASLGDMARIISRPVSLSISNEQSGDNTELFFDLSCDLEGEVLKNVTCDVTKDCYSTQYESSEEYKLIDTYSACCARSVSVTVNDTVKRKNTEINKIIDILCDPVYEKTEFKGGKATVIGKLGVTVIGAKHSDEEIIYSAENYDMPFKYSTEIGGCTEPITRVDLSVGALSARLDGDMININAEVYLGLEIFDKKSERVLELSALKKDRKIQRDAGCIHVYFPGEKSSIWDVAKKYHVSVSSLREQNDTEGEELDLDKGIII